MDTALAAIAEGTVALGTAGAQSIAQLLGSPPAGSSAYTGAALTGNAATPAQGAWQYSLNGGRSWSSLPTNLSVDGSAALLLSSDTLIRFAPAADFNGTPGALNLRPLSQTDLPWISVAAPYGNQQGFIASWISEYQDGSGQGVYAQRFSADGIPIGSEFRVNSTTNDNQGTPDLTQLSGGRFLISWNSHNQDGSSWGIYGQRYNPDATPLGGEFRINTVTNDQQSEPVVAALPDGGFLVSWMSHAQDGSSWGVYAQLYDASGAKTGDETLVNTTTSNQQHSPTIAVLTDGSYLIAYQGANHSGGSGWDIYAQRFSSSGSKLGNEIRLNDASLSWNGQEEPAIAPLANGGYVATWQDDGRDGNSWGIYARSFSADGTPNAAEFRVNTTTNNQQAEPEVAALADGSYVITWHSQNQDGSGQGVYAQRFSADGIPIGSEFRVNTHTDDNQSTPDITALADGSFVVSWQSYDQDESWGWGIYAQRFYADGTRAGSEFRLNSYTSNSQHEVNITSWGLPLQNLTTLGLTELADPIALTVEVTPVNDRPALTGTPAPLTGAAAGQTFSFSAADLLSGYTDVDGDSLSITAVSLVNTTAGILTGNADDGWTFTPAEGFIGTVDLAFSISDGTTTVSDHTSFSSGSGSGGNGSDFNDVLIGTADPDNLSGGASDDILDGMDGDDTLSGDAGSDQLRGGYGNDTLSGGDHDDILYGGSGDDKLSGDAGSDQLYGGRGNDLIDAGTSDDIATGDAGHDALLGGSGSDQLVGGDGDDFLQGDDGSDILQGGSGNDWLLGGSGSDEQRGGEGNDTFLAVGTTVSDDVFDGGDGLDTLITAAQSRWGEGGPNFVGASLRSIERLELLPTPTADEFNFWNWDISNYAQRGSRFSIDQLDQFDWIGAAQDASWNNELFSFSVRNLSSGWPSTNWRWLRVAGEGSLDLNASNWDPYTLYRIRTEAGQQTLAGSDNADWFATGDGDDILHGGGGQDTLLGEAGNDLIEGGSGNDRLEGQAGIDTLRGGRGDDVLIGGGSNDKVYGEAGNDTVELNWGQISITGGGGDDYWYDGNTTVTGIYDGGDGSDTLRIQAMQWSGSDQRGDGQTIDLRGASISNFERLDIGTSAILRLTGSQYSQFTAGISTVAGFEGQPRLAIDLAPGENLRFSRTAGINSASGALNISGTNSAFSDTLAINSDGTVDLSDPGTIISDVETLEVQRGTVILTAEQWNSFGSIRAKGDQRKEIVLTDSLGIDLSKFSRSGDSNTTIKLDLSVEQINSPDFGIFSAKFETSSGSKAAITVQGEGVINSQDWPIGITFNPGKATFASLTENGTEDNDIFELRLLGPFQINGRGGRDTLTLQANSDLSQGLLNSLEILDLNSFTVQMSSAQLNNLEKITGHGTIDLLDSDPFNSSLIAGINGGAGTETTAGITIRQPTPGAETIHRFGTAAADQQSGDAAIEVDFTSLMSTGSTRVSTPNRNWTPVKEFDIDLEVHPGSESYYSIAWNEWSGNHAIKAYRLQGSGLTLESALETQAFSPFGNWNQLQKDDVVMFLGASDQALFLQADELDWIADGSPKNSISLNIWSADLKPSVDYLYGLEGNDTLSGGLGNDVLIGGPGDDRLQGDSGFNAAVFSDIQSNYAIQFNTNEVSVEHLNGGEDGTDTLTDIQKLIFADSDFNIDDITNRYDLIAGTNAELGKPIRGTIDYPDDRDAWSLNLIEDSTIRILKTNIDSNRESWVDGPFYLGGWQSDGHFQVTSSGLHTLDLRGQDGAEYEITVLMEDDSSGDSSTNKGFADAQSSDPASNRVGGFIGFQQIDANGLVSWNTADHDWIRVDLVQGIQYEFQALGAASLPATGLNDPYLQRLLDPAITLHGPDGTPLVDGAPSANGSDPILVFRAEQSGTHFLAISSQSALATGSYAVTRSSLDEFGGDINTNGVLNLERSIQGVINQPGDQDWFRIALNAGDALVLELLGKSSNNGDLNDPWLGVYSASGQLLASDNNNGKGLDARLTWAAPTAGNYYVAAAALGNQGSGSYTLRSARRQDDAPDRLSSAFSYDLITPGTSLTGDLEVAGDRDWYQTILRQDKTYRISLTGEQAISSDYRALNDPALTLRGPSGRRLAFDDDGGLGLNAELIIQPTVTGRFFLEVQDATDRADGHYKLLVEEAVDDFGDTADTAHPLSAPTGSSPVTVQGRLDFRQDIDLFAIDLAAGQTYRFDLRGISSAAGSLHDPLLRINTPDGTLLATDDNGGVGNDAGLYFTSAANQTVLITAAAPAGQLGSYTLELAKAERPADDFGDSPANAGSLTPGTSQQGLLLTPGDTDWFSLSLTADQHYRFVLRGADSNSGTLADPLLELRDANGTLIDSADGGTLSRDAALGYRPSSDQIVHLVAKASSTELTGSYTITAYEPDEAGAGFETAAPLLLGTAFNAGIQSPDDTDWFRLDVIAGNTYTLAANTTPDQNGSLKTALIELFDATRTTISAADGRYTDGSATLAFQATTTGPLYLAVRGYRGGTGSYTLSASEGNQADLIGQTKQTASALSLGGDNRAVLELASDLDWFEIDVSAGNTYRFTMKGDIDGVTPPLVSPSLTAVEFEGDQLPPSPPNRRDRRLPGFLGSNAISLDSTISYTAERDGTLYLQAASVDNRALGAYRIEAVDLGDLSRDDHPDSPSTSAISLLAGQSRTGTIETSNDRDIFKLNLTTGQTYQLLLRGVGSNGGTLNDPRLRLLDANGDLIAASFDGVGTSDTGLLFSPTNSGAFFLEVAAEGGDSDIGSYTAELVSVSADGAGSSTDDLPSTRFTPAELLPKLTFESSLHSGDDTDWIRVDLLAGESYQFELTPRINQGGMPWTPRVDLIDSNGYRLTTSSDNGPGQTVRLLHKADQDETLFLAVASKDSTHGSYELTRRRLVSSAGDPLIERQWHLSNNSGNGLDLNLDALWSDYTGDNIRVGVIDDGILYSHPDLAAQLDGTADAGASFSFPDPGTLYDDANLNIGPKPEAGHGTAVTGLIAAGSANNRGLSGVAPAVSVSGYEVDWSPKSLALMLQKQLDTSTGGVDISNNSWGFLTPFADDFDSAQFAPLVQALTNGVQQGRDNGSQQLGINWVFSAGNARTLGDYTNYHGFQSSRLVTTVASTDRRGNTSFFSTPGASILVSAFGEDLYTSMLGDNNAPSYGTFEGTSAAAPLVSGVIALMLEANPELGYRDVQTILAYSARQVIEEGFKLNAATNWNGGGLHISHDQGFGLVDAHAAVRLAESWSATPATSANEQRVSQRVQKSAPIPDNSTSGVSLTTLVDRALDLEWAEVELDIRHPRIADLIVELISPAGTVARLINRPTVSPSNPTGDTSDDGLPDRIVFTTSASLFRGESSLGTWTLRVSDERSEITGSVSQWGLNLYGADHSENDTYIYTDEYQQVADSKRSLLLDSSGIDTLNAAAISTDSLLNLLPGAESRLAMRPLTLAADTLIEHAVTGDGDDVIRGNSADNHLSAGRGDDRFFQSPGSDTLDGGRGFDQLIVEANAKDFLLTQNSSTGSWTITDQRPSTNADFTGTSLLTNIERVVFFDQQRDLISANQPPTLSTSIDDLTFDSDVVFTHTFDTNLFADPDNDQQSHGPLNVEVRLADGRDLPGWLKFDPISGSLTGEPHAAAAGSYSLEIRATDTFGAASSQSFSLNIGTPNPNDSGSGLTPDTELTISWDLSLDTNHQQAGDELSVGDTFSVNINVADITNPNQPRSPFSAYTDLTYNPAVLRAIDITYGDAFQLFQSGDIDPIAGVIQDLGATLSSFSPTADTALASVRFEVISPGTADIALNRSQSDFLKTAVFERDGDQGPYSRFDVTSLSFSSPLPDIAIQSFQLANPRLQQGIAAFSYDIANYGHVNSLPFWIELHHTSNQHDPLSPDTIIWNQYFAADSITGLGSTGPISQSVAIDRAALYNAALAEDQAFLKTFGTPSSHQDWLHLRVNPEQHSADALISNNLASQSIQYFPWDVDDDGKVTTTDAVEMVNRIGPAADNSGISSIHDLDGDGFVTQTEVMNVVNRIGLIQSNLSI